MYRYIPCFEYENKRLLLLLLLESHSQYSWDNWPHEEGRSNCGYVGLTNLGATCYMATCMQHLYMIPEARKSVLEAQNIYSNRHEGTLYELKKMFAYLLVSKKSTGDIRFVSITLCGPFRAQS